jgi:uncharacterized protein (DUF1697 family)
MPGYAAFLRGINVGGRKTVPMQALKTLFEELGFAGVRTHLNSGNVVFASDERRRGTLAENIEAAIERRFGFRPAVMLRDARMLRTIVEENPFRTMAENDPSHLLVMLLARPAETDAASRLAAIYQGPEEFEPRGENVYLVYPDGIGRSKLTNPLLERHFGTGTARNWNTLRKLLALAETVEAA